MTANELGYEFGKLIPYIMLFSILGVLIGKLAEKRGYSFLPYFLISLFLSPIIGLIWVLVLTPKEAKASISEEKIICPFCKEEIKDGAIKCKHCGSMLNTTTTVNQKKISCPFCKEEIEEGVTICKHCNSKLN